MKTPRLYSFFLIKIFFSKNNLVDSMYFFIFAIDMAKTTLGFFLCS